MCSCGDLLFGLDVDAILQMEEDVARDGVGGLFPFAGGRHGNVGGTHLMQEVVSRHTKHQLPFAQRLPQTCVPYPVVTVHVRIIVSAAVEKRHPGADAPIERESEFSGKRIFVLRRIQVVVRLAF